MGGKSEGVFGFFTLFLTEFFYGVCCDPENGIMPVATLVVASVTADQIRRYDIRQKLYTPK